jgi:hypothetical protein
VVKKNAIKKFSLPPAKILRFNLKGKSVLDTSIADRLYLAQHDFPLSGSDDECAQSAWALKYTDWLIDWRAKNPGKSKEEEHVARDAGIAAGTVPIMPKSMTTRGGRTDPPAA